jgi:predicted transcriptional regulator
MDHGIGRAEMEVLRFISDLGSAGVGEVAEFLHDTKGQTRNTAQSVMERLCKKGYLEREKVDGVYRYTPSRAKASLVKELLDDFVNTVLGGSLTPLVSYLTDRVEVDDAQMDELKRLVRELEEKQRGK